VSSSPARGGRISPRGSTGWHSARVWRSAVTQSTARGKKSDADQSGGSAGHSPGEHLPPGAPRRYVRLHPSQLYSGHGTRVEDHGRVPQRRRRDLAVSRRGARAQPVASGYPAARSVSNSIMRRRRAYRLIVVIVIILLGLLLYRLDRLNLLPVIEYAAYLHSERGSTDCGHVKNHARGLGSDERSAFACASSASERHRPFTVILTESGIDETISTAIIGDSKGKAIQLFYATGMVDRTHTLLKHRCSQPTQLVLRAEVVQLYCLPWPPTAERDFMFW